MKQEMALRVRELRTGPVEHSMRALAEVICEEFPDEIKEMGWDPQRHSGNQLLGDELIMEAARDLGEDGHVW